MARRATRSTAVVERNRHDLHAGAGLIHAANERGGDDNITAVCSRSSRATPDDETVETVVRPPEAG
jgi:serine/threonine protein phosphatase PrpC